MENLDEKTKENISEQSEASRIGQAMLNQYDALFEGSDPDITIRCWGRGKLTAR